MNEEIPKPKKKFKGFTSLFKNETKKNAVKKGPPKKPFTGFSEFYKKLKDYEQYDEDDDYDSLYDPFIPRREIPKIVEKVEEPPTPVDEHFKPQKYFEWCKERSKEAFNRCAEEEGDVFYNEESGENEYSGSIKANSLIMGIKQSSRFRKYEDYRKNCDQSIKDDLSQASGDINPWFHKMFHKPPKDENIVDENQVQISIPEIDEGLRNIYEKLNAREKLEFYDKFSREVNTYPYDFQFKFLNNRMKTFLERTKHVKNINDAESDTLSSHGSENLPNPWNFNDELPCQKKELEYYFNQLMKPKREINFQPEDFKSWYTKMSFNYDRRFRDSNAMNITPKQEDFSDWVANNIEKMNKKYNEEYSKAMLDLKQTRSSAKSNTSRDRARNFTGIDSLSDLSRCNWSISNWSSCRSMAEKLL